ncbi:hypothetical protein BLOT_013805 [Blomia tropicalis]|nr:hypothetical protein BLOT_013805 [Blomia tropicalis]
METFHDRICTDLDDKWLIGGRKKRLPVIDQMNVHHGQKKQNRDCLTKYKIKSSKEKIIK